MVLDPRVVVLEGKVALAQVSYRPVLSSERALHTIKNRKYLKIMSMEGKKNFSWVPDGGLIPGQTGRLTVGRKIT
jgi:hypothetical protein